MQSEGFYGDEMMKHFHAEVPQTLVARTLQGAPSAITRVRYDHTHRE